MMVLEQIPGVVPVILDGDQYTRAVRFTFPDGLLVNVSRFRYETDGSKDWKIRSSDHDYMITIRNYDDPSRSPVDQEQTELESLRAWKESAMEVERQWDEQKVAKLLGIPLGASIRPEIQPRVEKLRSVNQELRASLVECSCALDLAVKFVDRFFHDGEILTSDASEVRDLLMGALNRIGSHHT